MVIYDALASALASLGKAIYDYQTLITGVAAIGAAYIAARPVWRQLALTQTQANGVLREMLLQRKAEVQQAHGGVVSNVAKRLNDMDWASNIEGDDLITEHQAHHYDMLISQAAYWLRVNYQWRDSTEVESAKATLLDDIDKLLSVLNEVHGPAHTDQHGEDYSMTDQQWAAFVARGEAAKSEVPQALRKCQTSFRTLLEKLDNERDALDVRLTKVNAALLAD